ncbi:dynamin family protein [Actinophytocola sediminis]
MRTPPWLTVLDDTIAACIAHHRADLASRLERRRALLLDPKLRVPVIGELNQGKSQLVNALLNAPVCAVGDDVTTTIPTTVEHAETPIAAVVADVPVTGRRAIGPAAGEPARVPVPFDQVATKALVTRRTDVHTEVGVPRELLAGGLVLIDTPGLGSGPARAATTFAALANADAVLMISDATRELCAAEFELIRKVVELCPTVTVVLTKIDIVPRWRRVAERNRARLAAAGLEVEVVPVSAAVRLAAARTGDQELNRESGFVDLVATLRRDVLGQGDVLASRCTAAMTTMVTQQLLEPLREQLAQARGGQLGGAHVQYRAAQRHLEELRKRSSRWQTMLGDEVAELMSDVEYDLRERTRRIIRTAEEFFEVADPARTWDEFADWLGDSLADTAEANFTWLVERFQWVSEKIARQVALEESIPDASVAEDLLEHIGDLRAPRVEKFTIGQQLFVGLRGSYGGLLMFGLATTLAGMPLINPISIGAGAAFGAKSVWDERGSRLKRRQAIAKSAAQRHVDDFFLSYGKESRDTSRLIQRRLRDHFSSVVEQVQAGIAERAVEAKRAAEADLADRHRRTQQISQEVDKLVGLNQRIQALATPSGPRGLTA